MPKRRWLLNRGRQIASSVRTSVVRWGIFGLLAIVMITFSGLRLLWSNQFPIGWWIILGLVLVIDILKDKFVWPRDRYVVELQREKQKEQLTPQEHGDSISTPEQNINS